MRSHIRDIQDPAHPHAGGLHASHTWSNSGQTGPPTQPCECNPEGGRVQLYQTFDSGHYSNHKTKGPVFQLLIHCRFMYSFCKIGVRLGIIFKINKLLFHLVSVQTPVIPLFSAFLAAWLTSPWPYRIEYSLRGALLLLPWLRSLGFCPQEASMMFQPLLKGSSLLSQFKVLSQASHSWAVYR